ncbi:MAG: alanine dehydrogenase [Lewinellaceae bacterium]|nr:alanine dehydrogenase [Lewinellaceae bacterium]
MFKIGIIREGKVPPDSRVPLTPEQCSYLQLNHPVDITVQPSPGRCFSDDEYHWSGVRLREDVSDCDILMGVKEVPVSMLIPEKTYLFFSHTIKAQLYNRKLLQAILAQKIRMIDYEVLTDEQGKRLIAFGRFAGMVGAHNALYTYGLRTGKFQLPRMKDFHDYQEAVKFYQQIEWPPVKIVLTGSGRVSTGAAAVLQDMGIREVSPTDFLTYNYPEPVFTQLYARHYVRHRGESPFDKTEFYQHPENFASIFFPYAQVADIFINGIFWDKRAPQFFTRAEMRRPDFHIRVIADVTCDIYPESSVPSTLRPSSIADPIYGYDPVTEQEVAPFQSHCIDIMAIDNLPNELPRDASQAFGLQFMEYILPEFFKPESAMLERATIARDGELGPRFQYLKDYVAG